MMWLWTQFYCDNTSEQGSIVNKYSFGKFQKEKNNKERPTERHVRPLARLTALVPLLGPLVLLYV